MTANEAGQSMSIPWALQMKAVSVEEPGRLVQILTGAILGCGGWVLSRGANDTGTINMLFEFERQVCVDVYSVLIAAGLCPEPPRTPLRATLHLADGTRITASPSWRLTPNDWNVRRIPCHSEQCCFRAP